MGCGARHVHKERIVRAIFQMLLYIAHRVVADGVQDEVRDVLYTHRGVKMGRYKNWMY